MNIRVTAAGSPLSEKELECVLWLADGKSAEEIAMIMGRSKWTIQKRIESAKQYAMVAKDTALVAKALRMGWIA